MNKYARFMVCVVLIGVTVTGCNAIPVQETVPAVHTKEATDTINQELEDTETPAGNVPERQEIQAKTPRLTLESSSEEIREKMLSSSFNWQTLEVEAITEYSSLNPDDSVAYTVYHHISTWIDQKGLRYRSEEKQPEMDIQPKLSISDGKVIINDGGETLIEGYPLITNPTMVSPVSPSITLENALDLMRSGDAIFPPMGEVYGGALGAQLFPSSYAVQNPGEYQALEMDTIAGRETLKVFYGDADRWGRANLKRTLWIDSETGVVLKSLTDGTPDHFTSSMEVIRILYNPKLADSLFEIEEAMPNLYLKSMQSKTINDITLYVGQLYVEDEKLRVQLCFDLPSTADWMIYGIHFNGIGPAGLGSDLDYFEQAGTLQEKGLCCNTLIFPETLPIGDVTLEIDQMEAPPREGEFCNNAEALQKDLDAEERGIRFTCIEAYGMTTIEINEKPQEMSEEEAQNVISTLLYQMNTPIIEGPWVFDLALQEE